MDKCICKGFYQPVDCPVHGKPPEHQFKSQYLGEFSHDPIFRTIRKLANKAMRDNKNNPSSNIIFSTYEAMKRNPGTERLLFECIDALASQSNEYFDMVLKLEKHKKVVHIIDRGEL